MLIYKQTSAVLCCIQLQTSYLLTKHKELAPNQPQNHTGRKGTRTLLLYTRPALQN